LVSKIIYYLCFVYLDTEENKTDIEIEATMEPQKMDTRGEEKLQISDDAKIIVQLERDEDKKRKRAHEDVVRNNLSISSHILTHEYLYNRVTDIIIILHM